MCLGSLRNRPLQIPTASFLLNPLTTHTYKQTPKHTHTLLAFSWQMKPGILSLLGQ